MPETVEIFKNKKTGLYLVQRQCPDPVLRGPTWFGQPEILSEEQLRRTGVSKLLEVLESSLKPCSDIQQLKHFTDEEYRKFCGSHHCVSITRWADGGGGLEVRPHRRVRGGYRSITEAMSIIAVEDIQSNLIDEILSAFKVIEED
jgi:hypothetical protein